MWLCDTSTRRTVGLRNGYTQERVLFDGGQRYVRELDPTSLREKGTAPVKPQQVQQLSTWCAGWLHSIDG
jgi:hypothetical protein